MTPEKRAEKLLPKYGVVGPEDLDLEAIAWGEGCLVTDGPLHGCQATLVSGPRIGIVRIREDLPFEGMRRFAIAHELGHWILHRGLRQEFTDTEESLADYRGSREEIEANEFASALILPERLVRDRVARLSAATIRDTTEEFAVGPVAAARRLVLLAPDPVIAIVAREGRARYYVKSESHVAGPFAPGRAIPAETDEGRQADEAVEPAHDWWPGRAGEVRVGTIPVEGTGETIYLVRPAA